MERPDDWPRSTAHDLDRAEMERCDVFSDFSPAQDRAFFTVLDDRWQAMLAEWRRENPGEAAEVDAALSRSY